MSLTSLPPEVLFGALGVLVILALVFLVRGVSGSRRALPPPVPLVAEDDQDVGFDDVVGRHHHVEWTTEGFPLLGMSLEMRANRES